MMFLASRTPVGTYECAGVGIRSNPPGLMKQIVSREEPEGNMRVQFEVRVTAEEVRPGQWSAQTDPLAITAYGDGPQVAADRAMKAMELLLSRHDSTPQELQAYLTRRKVPHLVLPAPEPNGVIDLATRRELLESRLLVTVDPTRDREALGAR